jgi:hypothetical protein
MPITKTTQNVIAGITATGSTTARNLENRFSDLLNVKDFGAVGNYYLPNGSVNPNPTDDAPAIQAAINATGESGLIYFPKGTYLLNSNVTTVGKIPSYIINPEATFTGAGNLNNPSTGYGFYYNGQSKDTKLSILKSDDKTGATATFVKYSTHGNSGINQNPSLYGLGYKFSTDVFSRVQGVFGEAIDAVGGNGSFVEGGRFHGICILAGSGANGAYGIITKGQSGSQSVSTQTAYVIGIESEVITFNTLGNAPAPRSFNVNRFSSCYLSTVRTSQIVDTAYLVNPYNDVPVEGGFIVAKGTGTSDYNGQPRKTVKSVAFGCFETGLVYGLDLAKGSYSFAAISIPNNSAIRAYNAAETNERNILTLNGVNILSLGVDDDIAHTQSKSFLPAADNTYQCGSSLAKWSAIWVQGGVVSGSDERYKSDISDSALGLDFIKKLRPVSYKWKVGGNEVISYDGDGSVKETKEIVGLRTHFGLLAQEVKSALPEGIDFGGWILTDKNDPDSQQALRYEQFIAPLIKAIQQLSEKIEKLENK